MVSSQLAITMGDGSEVRRSSPMALKGRDNNQSIQSFSLLLKLRSARRTKSISMYRSLNPVRKEKPLRCYCHGPCSIALVHPRRKLYPKCSRSMCLGLTVPAATLIDYSGSSRVAPSEARLAMGSTHYQVFLSRQDLQSRAYTLPAVHIVFLCWSYQPSYES